MGKELRLSSQNFDLEAALQFVQHRFLVMQRDDASQLSLALHTTEETWLDPAAQQIGLLYSWR